MYEFEKHRQWVKRQVSSVSLLMLLAEENAELTQAALKYIRALGIHSDNPTPVTEDEAWAGLVEESRDVLMILDAMGLTVEDTGYNSKWKRWAERLGYRS